MYRWKFYLLFFSEMTVASPVNLVATPSGSACVVILLALVVLLLFLALVKRLFIKHRQLRIGNSHSSRSESSFVGESFTRSSASILPLNLKNNHGVGILVGFLGSPAWETRVKLVTDPAIWKQHKQCSAIYNLHSQHRLVGKSHSLAWNTKKMKPTLDAGQFQSIPATMFDGVHAYNIRDASVSESTTRPLRLPSRPLNVHTSSIAIPRRLSMPSLRGKEIRDSSHLKRFSSLTYSRLSHSDISTSRSLRLVENMSGPEYPLPLYPIQLYASPSLLQSASYHPTDGSNSDSCIILPSLTTSIIGPQSPDSAALQISPPYALTSKPRCISPFVSPLAINVPLSRRKEFNERSRFTLPALSTKADCLTPITSRNPLTPVSSSTNVDPSIVPLNSVHSVNVRQKARSRSLRVRRSPPIGPSPLRTMFLPDHFDTSPSSHNNAIDSECKDYAKGFGPTYYGRHSYGFPSPAVTKTSPANHLGTSQDRSPGRHTKAAATKTYDEGPNTLISIIRELVEETSEWDASLFMDDNFKSLIQNSGLLLSGKTADNSDRENNNSTRNFIPSDESQQLDVSLYIRSNGVTFVSDHNLARQEPSSYWDEGGWDNDQGNTM
jgi:hypothetical protein